MFTNGVRRSTMFSIAHRHVRRRTTDVLADVLPGVLANMLGNMLHQRALPACERLTIARCSPLWFVAQRCAPPLSDLFRCSSTCSPTFSAYVLSGRARRCALATWSPAYTLQCTCNSIFPLHFQPLNLTYKFIFNLSPKCTLWYTTEDRREGVEQGKER